MLEYNPHFIPPAPILTITLSSLTNREHQETLPALIDTGSDITAIPEDLVEQFQLLPIGKIQFEDVKGEDYSEPTFALQIAFQGFTIPPIEVVPSGLGIVILGRDVLNRYYLLLNGPTKTFQIAQTPLA